MFLSLDAFCKLGAGLFDHRFAVCFCAPCGAGHVACVEFRYFVELFVFKIGYVMRKKMKYGSSK